MVAGVVAVLQRWVLSVALGSARKVQAVRAAAVSAIGGCACSQQPGNLFRRLRMPNGDDPTVAIGRGLKLGMPLPQ